MRKSGSSVNWRPVDDDRMGRISSRRKSSGKEPASQAIRKLSYEDWCVYECLNDPILCQELLLPPPGIAGVGAADLWPQKCRRLWLPQYRMILPSKVACASAKHQGKALSLDTLIPTPSGWTTMGEVKVGDTIYDEKGNTCKVSFVTETMWNRECYKVVFNDGNSIIADADHQWIVWSINDCKNYDYYKKDTSFFPTDWASWRPRKSTEDIQKNMLGAKRERYVIPLTAPLQTPEVYLPIDPYVLGYLLGNGDTSDGGRVACNPQDKNFLLNEFRRRGYSCNAHKDNHFWARGIREPWNKMGLCDSKRVPQIYLRGSVQQRKDLLMGLIDADGCALEDGQYSFRNTNYNLITAVCELANSLGIVSRVYKRAQSKSAEKPCWILRLFSTISLSRNPRKEQKATHSRRRQQLSRTITSIERVASVPVKCLQVDSQSKMYLAGRGMIPTHNTEVGIVGHTIYRTIKYANSVTVIVAPQEKHMERIFRKVLDLFIHHPILHYWLANTTDYRGTGVFSRRQAILKLRNNAKVKGVIPGLHGVGFKGERATAIIVDEAQDISQEAAAQLADILDKPFDTSLGSEEKWFGVPNGDQTCYFHYIATKSPSFAGYAIRFPGHIHPGVTEEEFTNSLDKYGCKWEYTLTPYGKQVTVREWTNAAVQNMLGYWGSPSTACFPPNVYERNTVDDLRGNAPEVYRRIVLKPQDCYDFSQDIPASHNPATIDFSFLKNTLVHYDQGRREFSPKEVAITIDPGKRICTVFVWMKWHPLRSSEWDRWWLVRCYQLANFTSGLVQAAVVNVIANWWGADWLASDTTSTSAYLVDGLRYIGRDRSVLLTHDDWLREMNLNQRVIALNFGSKITVGFDEEGKPLARNTDIETTNLAQDLLAPVANLVLPTAGQDPDMYNEMMSYRERVGVSGKMFLPPHPHFVSAFKVFAGALSLLRLYSDYVVAKEPEVDIPDYGVTFFGR